MGEVLAMLRVDFVRVLVLVSLIAGAGGCAASGVARRARPIAEAPVLLSGAIPGILRASERAPCQGEDSPLALVSAETDTARVLRAMHGDLLGCYEQRLSTNAGAHAFLVAEIVVGPRGDVRRVDTTGGALLGPRALACIRGAIARAAFPADPTGGTSRVSVPLDFVLD